MKAVLFVAALASLSTNASGCERLAPTVVLLSIDEQPVTTQRDLSLATLSDLSRQAGRRPVHLILGFYSQTIAVLSARVRLVTAEALQGDHHASCPHLEIRSELVAADRRIAIASDLAGSTCLLHAATAHYGHHAATASHELHQFAIDLPKQLGPEVDRLVRSRSWEPRTVDGGLQEFIDNLLTRSLASFTASLVEIQKQVDSPEEVQSLAPCEDT